MPHALSERQKEYLEFIRNFVANNESSPRLDEIAEHFNVRAPTAHRALEALQAKGYLYFGRDSVSGFFIRLIQRAGAAENVIEVPIAGKVNRLGEVHDFPTNHGHFASVVVGSDPSKTFALALTENLPKVNMLQNDLLLCEYDRRPQPGDICILPFGERYFLIRVQSKTYDREITSWVMRQEYPVSGKRESEREQLLNWFPLAFDHENEDYFYQLAKDVGLPESPMREDWAVAVVFRLSRQLSF